MAEFTCLTISDFNLGNFNALLALDPEPPAVKVVATPFGHVSQALANGQAESARNKYDSVVVWTQPHSVIKAFQRVCGGEKVSTVELLSEVDRYSSQLLGLREQARSAIIPAWTLPFFDRGAGMLEMRAGCGLRRLLLQMNLRLCENLDRASTFFVLNTQTWIERAGPRSWDLKLWYLAKCPLSNEVFKEAVRDIKAALSGLVGNARKIIIVDLDETLWGGVVGDLGWEHLTLGGHDSEGEALVDFQMSLKAVSRRGILLGIVSKNDESLALEALDNHPEMILSRHDFAGWRINWKDKAQNIADLAAELGLGLESVVFIDDNPFERARVREALPAVLVPEWPSDKRLYRRALVSLRCFDGPSLSAEDRERTRMYATERQRTALRKTVGDPDEWLWSLETVVTVEPLGAANLPRAAQLLNKTNQMNLSTRRLTESELTAWANKTGHLFWTIRVADRFGDAGLTGLLSLAKQGSRAQIVDFVLSCRVLGRKVEEAMVAFAIERARTLGATVVTAELIETARNRACLEFLRRSGLAAGDNGRSFCWALSRDYPLPEQLKLVWKS